MNRPLDLVLCHQWYDMITKGPKREEYREKNPYWYKRMWRYHPGDIVRFRRGYSSTFADYRIVNISTGNGRTEWGAPSHECYIIKFEDL